MSKKNTISWLQAHAEAHRARANEYATRCNLYRWGGATESDMRDCQQAADLMQQHIDYAIALELAAEAMTLNQHPHLLPPIAPPIPSSYSDIVARKEAQ